MKRCKYYPCHKNLENCRYCYCPLYPCGDFSTGGEWIRSKNEELIWSCQNCDWIHQNKIVKRVGQYFRNSSKVSYSLEDLFSIKMELLGLKSKTSKPPKKISRPANR